MNAPTRGLGTSRGSMRASGQPDVCSFNAGVAPSGIGDWLIFSSFQHPHREKDNSRCTDMSGWTQGCRPLLGPSEYPGAACVPLGNLMSFNAGVARRGEVFVSKFGRIYSHFDARHCVTIGSYIVAHCSMSAVDQGPVKNFLVHFQSVLLVKLFLLSTRQNMFWKEVL